MDTKALRQKILDLAIRGKLVPQNPDEEPASVLLEKIRAEKQQMVKDGKLKAKDIKRDTVIFCGDDNLHYEKFADGTVKCIENEIPFEVPEGWAWCRLGTISNIVTGRLDANAQIVNGKYPFFTCGEEVLLTDSYAFDCNAILLGGNNATGNFKMHRYNGKFNAYQRVYVITSYIELNMDYLYIGIQTYLPSLQKLSIGSQTRYLKLGMVQNLLIPLPPLCEQKCITEIFFGYIEQVEQIESNKLCLAQLINSTKSKILDLAIRGKLVPQNPDDEPASVLLNRIRAEKEELIKQGKIKRDKKESIIYRGDDNSYYEKFADGTIQCIEKDIPFQIPANWTFEKLRNLFLINPKNLLNDELKVSFIPMSLIDDNYSGKYSYEEKDWRSCKKGFTHFASGDVAFAKISPCFENRKSVLFGELLNRYGAGTTELYVLRRFTGDILGEYLLAFLKSEYFISRGKNTFSGVVGQQRLDKEYILDTLFPIPPLRIQKLIVMQIQSIMENLVTIETRLS